MSEVLSYFSQYISKIDNEETKNSYKAFVNSFTKYLCGREITFDDITNDFTSDYQQWMIKSGRTQKYIIRLGKHFRKLYRSAVKDGLASPNDAAFDWVKNVVERGSEIKSNKGQKNTIDALRTLLHKDLSQQKPLERVRDLFLFSVLCGGLTFEDIYNLKSSAISDGCLQVQCEGREHVIQISALAEELLMQVRRACDEEYLLPCYQGVLPIDAAAERWLSGLDMVFRITLDKKFDITESIAAQFCESAMKDAGVNLGTIKSALSHPTNSALTELVYTEATPKDIASAYSSLSNAIKDVRKKWYAAYIISDYEKFERELNPEHMLETYYPMDAISKYASNLADKEQSSVLKRILFVHATDKQIADFAKAIFSRGFIYKNPVGSRTKYSAISDSVMKQFRLLLSHGEDFEPEDFAENDCIKPNDNVTITDDYFAGKEALVIRKVGKDKYLVKVLNAAFTLTYTVPKSYIKKK